MLNKKYLPSVIVLYINYFLHGIGLACAYNAGGGAGYKIAYICAIVGGIANSFLDTGIYPVVAEIINKAPSIATMGIKFFIAISQMLLPFFLGATVVTTATGATSYNRLFYIVGILYIVMMAHLSSSCQCLILITRRPQRRRQDLSRILRALSSQQVQSQ